MKSSITFLLICAAACSLPGRVPDAGRQGVALAPQAISSVEVGPDGRSIAVTTLAFRQDPNFWVLSSEGERTFGRNVAPWAPYQGFSLGIGKASAVGLAYSRVTSPLPTISLFADEKAPETVLEDSLGEWGWARYGAGDWRTGWTASLLGDLLVRAGDSVVTVRGHNGSVRMGPDGLPLKYPLRYDRPFRWATDREGRTLVAGYLVPEAGDLPPEIRSALRIPPGLLTLSEAAGARELWVYRPGAPASRIPELPDPGREFPELAASFKMSPDARVPFRGALSVSLSGDGSRAAAAEYAGTLWVRRTPAIGAWNPPYHVIPFVPRQRGWLNLVSSEGKDAVRVEFPREGLFEVRADRSGDRVWVFPMSWFARGMAGVPWLPADPDARNVELFDRSKGTWQPAWNLPDAVSDLALHPKGEHAVVSSWDGNLYRLRPEHPAQKLAELGAPARLSWSPDGSFLIAGTQDGRVVRMDEEGTVRWRLDLPTAGEPAGEPPQKTVAPGVPIYSVGRTGKEHAYVGDTWLVKTPEGGLLVDAGGSSSIPFTRARIRAAGIDLGEVKYLLHTHSHGDHAGASYLWRAMGLRIVAPESAAYALSWLMPTLTDYGVWVPRPVDVPLPLKRAGDETEFTVSGQKIRAIFVPGHSMDSVVYLLELEGKRVAFTGDIGFQAPSDILHRCWTDADHAARVIEVVRTKVLPFHPDVVFTGHGMRAEGTAFLEDLVKRSVESIEKARSK